VKPSPNSPPRPFLLPPRIVFPELLDTLDPNDLRAIRSRRDLRAIDRWLGISRWILHTAIRHSQAMCRGSVELGAGDGRLSSLLARALPAARCTALDLHPQVPPPGVRWVQGNLLETLRSADAGVAVGGMILHHFTDPSLRSIGDQLKRFDVLIFVEPWRSRVALALASLAAPLGGEVTRHDMPASIRAGFRRGELPGLLGLDPAAWEIRESVQWRGSIRMVAWRR